MTAQTHPAISEALAALRYQISVEEDPSFFDLWVKAYAKLLDPETPHEAHDLLSPHQDISGTCEQVCDLIEEYITEICAEDEGDCCPTV